MGNTVPVPRYGCCIPRSSSYTNNCMENHSSTPRVKGQGHRRNLSAAFNMTSDSIEYAVTQLNVNTACEEELMTLPGINRETARNIVDYRRQIGRFKKVEDVALVSGVGATKLAQIRSEICVSHRQASIASSLSASQADMSNAETVIFREDEESRLSRDSRPSSAKSLVGASTAMSININQANVFQLMKVRGLSQQLAENIVTHRDRKGAFKGVDDLLKVKGISEPMLSSLRPYLAVNGGTDCSLAGNNCAALSAGSDNNACLASERDDNLSSILNLMKLLGKSEEDIMFHVGPLAHQSFRRSRLSQLNNDHERRSVMRLGSWNIEQCSAQKAHNPGVKEVLTMTLLENRIDILALQDVLDVEALVKFCDELNHPTIPNVRKWTSEHHYWSHLMSTDNNEQSKLGFLYNANRISDIVQQSFNSETIDGLFIGFKLKGESVVFVNVHLKQKIFDDDESHTSIDAFLKQLSSFADQSTVVVTGDFSVRSILTNVLHKSGIKSLLDENNYTDISLDQPEGSANNVNILLKENVGKWTFGECDVVREGLTNPWIPNGWSWGGLASSHCPVWAEFSCEIIDPYASTVMGSNRKRPNGLAGLRS